MEKCDLNKSDVTFEKGRKKSGHEKGGTEKKIKSHKHWHWAVRRGVCEEGSLTYIKTKTLTHLCSLGLQTQ